MNLLAKYFLYLFFTLITGCRVYVCDEFLDESADAPTTVFSSVTSTEYEDVVSEDDDYISVDSNTSFKYENSSERPKNIIKNRNSTFNSFTTASVAEVWNATDNPNDCPDNLVLPPKGTGEEVNDSLKILLMLFVVAACCFLIHFLLRSSFHYIPESTVVVFTGALFGAFYEVFYGHLPGDFKKKEAFEPTTFFLFFLPPIMYESAYNLHKGNFFSNFGSILFFAVFGTTLSAFVIGGSIFLLGQQQLVYEMTFTESFAYGTFLSAVDPVATLAIFQALEVDSVLNMLVIGESILNDAVAIVLAGTVFEASQSETAVEDSISITLLKCALRFTTIFLSSSAVGLLSGLFAALVFKHVDFRKYPWMEFAMMLIFIYTPYCIAEVLGLSAIMTILFNGIVMSHYTHFNLSRLVQSIMQITLRSMAFIAETCVFAYLGVSIFSYHMILELPFVLASIMLCLVARALNIFPLSFIANLFRQHEITPKMMFVMWFSAIRGAVSFALALRFEFEEKKRNVIITATLIIVLFTTIVFGGGTMPLLMYLQRKDETQQSETEPCHSEVCLIKTEKFGETIDAEMVSDVEGVDLVGARNLFVQLDTKYLMPFFTRSVNRFHGSDAESKTSECFAKEWYLPR